MEYRTVDIETFLRATAITLVVFNHATWWEIAGGMNFLLMLSGYNLARCSFSDGVKKITANYVKTTSRMLLASLVVVIIFFVIEQEFYWQDIFFVSFVLQSPGAATLHLWFPQAYWQMAVILIMMFYLTGFDYWLKKSAKVTCAVVWIVCLLMVLYYNQAYPWNRIPLFFLWNFVLGWLLWTLDYKNDLVAKVMASLAVIISALVALVLVDHMPNPVSFRFEIFLLLCLVFIWLDKIRLPQLLQRLVLVISGAAFTIYLYHIFAFMLVNSWFEYQVIGYKPFVLLKVILTLFMCVLVWALYHALRVAFVKRFSHMGQPIVFKKSKDKAY